MTARAIFLFLAVCLSTPFDTAAAPAISQAVCDRMSVRGVLAKNAPVGCEKLAVVRFSYIDFEGRTHHDGEIMVMMAVADFVQTVFDTLYSRRFPIARARLMDHYSGDDMAAMRDNNTSAFNHRPISGGNLPSLHAYGLAIDLNPVQNPYIRIDPDGRAAFSPASGSAYANRSAARPGKRMRAGMAEDAVALFADNGFLVWGGDWDAPIDYQHFQVERNLAGRMAGLPVEQARNLFTDHVARYRACMKKYQNAIGIVKDARIKCIEIHKN